MDPRHEAQDPATPPARLAALAQQPDAVLQDAVAQNPNTPPEALLALIPAHAASFAQNPVLSLWLLTEPERFAALSEEARQALARISGLPAPLYALLYEGRHYLQLSLAQDTKAAPEVLVRLASHAEMLTRSRVAQNPATPPEVMSRLARDQRWEVRAAVIWNPGADPALLASLCHDKSQEVRDQLASQRRTPPAALLALARDLRPEIRRHAAQNPSQPTEGLALLARDRDEKVREYVALHASADPEIFARLAQDHAASVRSSVARNPRTPPPLLAHLAHDPNLYVRASAAGNTATPEEGLAHLVSSPQKEVRLALAKAAHSARWLSALHADTNLEVLIALVVNEASPDALRWTIFQRSISGLRGIQSYRSPRQELCGRIATHTRDPALLAALSREEPRAVRRLVAENRATPRPLLEEMRRAIPDNDPLAPYLDACLARSHAHEPSP